MGWDDRSCLFSLFQVAAESTLPAMSSSSTCSLAANCRPLIGFLKCYMEKGGKKGPKD